MRGSHLQASLSLSLAQKKHVSPTLSAVSPAGVTCAMLNFCWTPARTHHSKPCTRAATTVHTSPLWELMLPLSITSSTTASPASGTPSYPRRWCQSRWTCSSWTMRLGCSGSPWSYISLSLLCHARHCSPANLCSCSFNHRPLLLMGTQDSPEGASVHSLRAHLVVEGCRWVRRG